MNLETSKIITTNFATSKIGTSFKAQLFSLKGGNIRINFKAKHPVWYIDPKNTTDFFFNFTKIDEDHVSISPVYSGYHKDLYSSVRNDYKWQLSVKNPSNSKWITKVDKKERIRIRIGDLMMTRLYGFNKSIIKYKGIVAANEGAHVTRVPNISLLPKEETTWFLSMAKAAGRIGISTENKTTESELKLVLEKQDLKLTTKEFDTLLQIINTR